MAWQAKYYIISAFGVLVHLLCCVSHVTREGCASAHPHLFLHHMLVLINYKIPNFSYYTYISFSSVEIFGFSKRLSMLWPHVTSHHALI